LLRRKDQARKGEAATIIVNMKPNLLWLSFMLVLSCKEAAVPEKPDLYKEAEAINALMHEQETAWNMADLESFMDPYWKSDSPKFVGRKGLTYGWQRTLDNYRSGYPDAAAMGKLHFTNYTVDVLDPLNAYVIGKWELFRVSDTLSGHYTLLWKKMGNKWFIVADHSS
jgi:hypothetical protein